MGVEEQRQRSSRLLAFLRTEKDKHTKRVSYVRSDAEADANVEVRQVKFDGRIHLDDRTKTFRKAILNKVPETGRVIFVNVPIFAQPGMGKTILSETIALDIIEHYGRDNVAVYLSNNLPSLADAMTSKRNTPVVVLIIDDALKELNSRSGSNDQLIEAIDVFTTLRHEYMEAQHTLNGIVFTLFTAQMYKGLDKVFREGFAIFKSALVSDKEEIVKATGMSKEAWEFINQTYRDVMVHHKEDKLSEAVVILPGYDAGKISLPMRNDDLVESLLKEMSARGTDAATDALESPHAAVRYKALQLGWTIQRTRLTPEQELIRLNTLMDKLALEFAQEREDNPAQEEGKAAVQSWLKARFFDVTMVPERRIGMEDFMKLRDKKNERSIYQKIIEARKKIAMGRFASEGFIIDGEMGKDDLIEYAARKVMGEYSFDPFDSDDKKRLLSLLYKLPHDIRNEAVKLKSAIESRCVDLRMRGGGYRRRGDVKDDTPASIREEEAAKELAAVTVSGDFVQFKIDAVGLLDRLIEKARQSSDKKTYNGLVVYRACKFLAKYGDRTLSNPTEIANTQEGVAWQKEFLDLTDPSQGYSRPHIQKFKAAGEGFFSNQVGLLFEEWVEQRLKEGLTLKGVFDRAAIKSVKRGGGNRNDPDVIVTYVDGRKDYVSLKCYHSSESVSITTSPKHGSDEIQPERHALAADEAQGILGNRVVVLLRNLFFDGLQSTRVFTRTGDIPENLGFGQKDIGKDPWTKPERAADADDVEDEGEEE